MIIAVDFDGTCVTHDYPKMGKEIGAEEVLKEIVKNGHSLMLWTIRCDEELEEAVKWFKDRDIPLLGINKNPTQFWSSSPKAYAHLYIDDAALGCPLRWEDTFHSRPYVDWKRVRNILIELDVIISDDPKETYFKEETLKEEEV